MRVLVDTGVLLCGCLLLALIVGQAGTATVIWLIAAVTIAGLSMTVDQRRWGIAVPAAYLLVGALSADSVAGVPLVVYALARLGALGTRRARMAAVAVCIPFVAAVAARVRDTPVLALALVFCALAALLALRTVQEEAARRSLHAVRDDLREKVLTLQDTNAWLLQAQDYELRAAALAERTRIACEIHDGVGHLLTRLLLQVKALQVVHRDEPGVVADLTTLDGGLDEALELHAPLRPRPVRRRRGAGHLPQHAGLALRHRLGTCGLLHRGRAAGSGGTLRRRRGARGPDQRRPPRWGPLGPRGRHRLPCVLAGDR